MNKLTKASKRVVELHAEREKLSPQEIIEELKSIRRDNDFIPGFPPWHKNRLVVYEIFSTLAQSSELTSKIARIIVKMLDWTEHAVEESYGNILSALERFPQRQFIGRLQRFIKRMKKIMKEVGPGKPRYADAAGNKQWAEKILRVCESL